MSRGERRRALFHLWFQGASENARCIGEELGDENVSYFRGTEPPDWISGVRPARVVRIEDVWDGVDCVLRSGEVGLEYDFELDPGIDPARIELRLEGVD